MNAGITTDKMNGLKHDINAFISRAGASRVGGSLEIKEILCVGWAVLLRVQEGWTQRFDEHCPPRESRLVSISHGASQMDKTATGWTLTRPDRLPQELDTPLSCSNW